MNTLPAIYPVAENIPYKVCNGYGSTKEEYHTLTPYNDIKNNLATISRLKINIPFTDIITRDMGFSICPHCKAKYVGHELKCQKTVTWYSTGSYDYNSTYYRGNYMVGERIKTTYDTDWVKRTKMDRCNSDTVWDFQKQFDEQQAFFSFVSVLGSIPEEKTDLLAKFSNCLPQGMEDKHRISLLEQQVLTQSGEISRIMNGMTQIAQKMQSAGSALCW